MKVTTAPANLNAKGYQQLAPSVSTALTVPAGAQVALLQAITQDIRWRDDGVAPTASVGMLLKAGANPSPYVGELANLRFIEAAATAELSVSYYSIVS